MSRRRTLLIGTVIVCVGLGAMSDAASADTFWVDSTTDGVDADTGDEACLTATGKCTLRAAIMQANATPSVDVIILEAKTYALAIPGVGTNGAESGDLDITDHLSITGRGADVTVISGDGLDRVFEIHSGASVGIGRLTICDGDAGASGGGILNAGTLTLGRVTVRDNTSGGIVQDEPSASLDMTDCTVSNNGGPGIYSSNANSAATLTNCTISGNVDVTTGGVGAIYVGDTGSTLSLLNCTIFGNSGSLAGGIFSSVAAVTLKNTILANNSPVNCAASPGPFTSAGYNLASDATCFLTGPGDLPSTNPQLGPLQDNGGPTLTHAPLSISPAIDAGTNSGCPGTDQRGFSRPEDGGGGPLAVCDIGAVEYRDLNTDGIDDGAQGVSFDFFEPFELYASQAAFEGVWPDSGDSFYYLDTNGLHGNPGQSLAMPSPSTNGAGRYYHNLGTDLNVTETESLLFSYDLWLNTNGAPSLWVGARHYAELRGYSGDAYGQGGLENLLAVGVANFATGRADQTKYQGRVLFKPAPTWLDLAAGPDRMSDYHEMMIVVTDTHVKFYVDGQLSATEDRPHGLGFDVAVLGSNLTSAGHDGRIDNVRIRVMADCNGNLILDGADITAGTSFDCNTNGIPDECETDCNENAIPDDCDIAAGTSPDCNTNAIPDECDIAQGTSDDCQPNGIPDECDLAPGPGYVYQVDDGVPSFPDGFPGGGYWAWINHFTIEAGSETITDIWVMWGDVTTGGTPATVYLWSDPNSDGDPTDAQVLTSAPVAAQPLLTVTVVDIPDTFVGPVGTSFFVGCIIAHGFFDQPAMLDSGSSGLPFESWLAGSDIFWPIDPNDLGAATLPPIPNLVYYGSPFNWMLRAIAVSSSTDCNYNGIPDECELAGNDCNSNGVPDDCDIAFGTSQDCNTNTVPDECDIAAGTSQDCNTNTVPDECDLAQCTGQPWCRDCNSNGVPDGCESIAVARAAGAGAEVTIACAVISSATDLIAAGTAKNFHVQDLTGGITVYGSNTDIESVLGAASEGHLISITAVTESYYGLYELNLYTGPFDATSNGFVGVPAPAPVTVADFQDGSPAAEVFESMLVTLSGVTFLEQGDFQGLTNYTVTDGSLTAMVRIATNEQDLVGQPIPCGRIDITGIFSQFDASEPYDGGYHLLPRSIADIVSVDCNSNGIGDDQDIAGGTSQDCNTNCIPDECDIAECPPDDPACGDCNTNAVPDECDIAYGTSQDCNVNAIPDECDIAFGTSEDCNDNDIPDECDLADCTAQAWCSDCNSNGILDVCDIADCAGDPACGDCDTNGVPDGCEYDTTDCDTNGLADACELAQGLAPDCNGNSVPDQCDIAVGTSLDCNNNGVPDECDLANCTGQPWCSDCNSNGIIDWCDIATGASANCNNNQIPDECDIAQGTSADADTDGILDECAVWDPQGGDNLWSNHLNWDDDTGIEEYVPGVGTSGAVESVVIDELGAIVILDVSASVDSLLLGPDSTLNVTSVTTNGDLTIDTANGVHNDGTLIIGAGRALIVDLGVGSAALITGTQPIELDAPSAEIRSDAPGDTLTNQATIQGQGAITAELANEGTIQANVTGSTLTVEGSHTKTNDGVFKAVNGATLRVTNTSVGGTGAFVASGGTLSLDPGGGRSAAVAGATLTVGSNGLAEVSGDASIILTGVATVTTGGTYQGVGTTSASLTAGGVLIDNAGVGIGGNMVLSSSMSLDASGGAVTVIGCECPTGRSCTPPVFEVLGSAMVSATSLGVSDGGQTLLGAAPPKSRGTPSVVVAGAVTVDSGGLITGQAGSTASLAAGSMAISNTAGPGGEVHLDYDMDLDISGDLTLTHCGCPTGRSCTPPVFDVQGTAQVAIGGTLGLVGASSAREVSDGPQVVVLSSQPVTLAGDFDNRSADAAAFDWGDGELLLDGTAPQTFEVAGTDVEASADGLVDNFAIGRLEVAATATVTFVDAVDNDGQAQASCGEALYLHTLLLRGGATVELVDCRIYCEHLTDQGASIVTSGCGGIVIIPTGDFDDDGDVDLDDYEFFPDCMDGPGTAWTDPDCAIVDFDLDGDVDMGDFAAFQELFSG